MYALHTRGMGEVCPLTEREEDMALMENAQPSEKFPTSTSNVDSGNGDGPQDAPKTHQDAIRATFGSGVDSDDLADRALAWVAKQMLLRPGVIERANTRTGRWGRHVVWYVLFRSEWSIREIGARFGLHENTVRWAVDEIENKAKAGKPLGVEAVELGRRFRVQVRKLGV